MTTAGLSAVQQWLNEGTPPAPQQNDNTNILSPTFATVGIGIVTGAGKTFIIVLFK